MAKLIIISFAVLNFCIMNRIIPIFPLNLVVFPNSLYPLHIFEPRYKTLIKQCLENDTGFGIVASFENKISDVGVYVKISDVIKKYDNGESDIVVEGLERFLIVNVKDNPIGFLEAEIEEFSDEELILDFDLEDKVQEMFRSLIEQINYDLPENFWRSLSDSEIKSFKVAEKSGLSIQQQQELLILQSENQRLKYLINHFELLQQKLSDSLVLKQIIMNDGYLVKEK